MDDIETREVIRRLSALGAQKNEDTMLRRLAMWARWLATDTCIIRNTHEALVPLHPNRTQLLLIATLMLQAAANRPLRLVVLKARKLGVTTLVRSLFNFLAAHYRQQVGATLAHLASSTDEIFQIDKLMAQHYTGQPRRRIRARSIVYPISDSRVWCHTAGGGGVGAGGTPNLMHLSERALWQIKAIDAEAAAVNAVPNTPTSILIQESTARGRDRFWQAFEKARNGQSEYDAIFAPWYYDNTLSSPAPKPFERDDDEILVASSARNEGIELSDDALQWRRMKIAEIGPTLFKQEYPSTPQEAVEASRGLVLPGLRDCVVDEFPFTSAKYDQCVGGIDFGYADPTVIVTGYYVDQVIWIEHVWRRSRSLAKHRAKACQAGHTYYCDPSALDARKELEEAVPANVELKPAPRTRGERTFDYVGHEWERLRSAIVQGRIKILDEAASQILIESENFMWNENTGRPDQSRGEAWGHFDTLDAVRYLSMGVLEDPREFDQPAPPPARSRRAGYRRW